MEATNTKEILLDWLRDAHAMEKAAIEILEKQEKRLENYPRMQDRVRQHLEESRQQAKMVEGCIEQLGGSTSAVKTGIGNLMGNMAALSNTAAADEVIKDGIADFAFEHFEIASYRSLIAAAEVVGEPEIRNVCEQILRQEEAMANWLEQNLPATTQDFLQRKQLDVPAKR